MTPAEIESKLAHLRDRHWTRAQIQTWYGIDWEEPATQRILVQAGWFEGTFEHPTTFGAGPFDRFHLEIFLQRMELVAVATAAAEWAMSVATFKEVVVAFGRSEWCSNVGVGGPSSTIVRRSFLRDFHKGFDSLRRSVFSSHTSYIERIHHVIREKLHVPVTMLKDVTDVALDIEAPRPGYRIDCLTGDPVGMGREIYLETGKPIQLAPDCCSWLTFAKHEEALRPHALGTGTRPGLTQATLERLREA